MVQEKNLLAVVTTDKDIVLNSGAPVILARDEEQLQKLASELGRILAGNIHRLSNGVVIITTT